MADGGQFLILFNPSAGGGKAVKKKEELKALLGRYGVKHELAVTPSEAHLRHLALEGGRTGRPLAAAGGDSTFHIVVNEIMKAGPRGPLALIGIGSSNDVALEFGVETLDKACRALQAGRTRKIDLGVIRHGAAPPVYFLGQANIGLGAAVNRYVAGLAQKKSLWSRNQTAAGIFGILDAYRTRKVPIPLEVGSENDRTEGVFVLAVFSNIRYWATGKKLLPEARPDDGRLDACLFEACSFLRLARINSLINRGRHGSCREVEMLQAPSFEVESDAPFHVQTDGEMLADSPGSEPLTLNRVRFETLPGALDLIC